MGSVSGVAVSERVEQVDRRKRESTSHLIRVRRSWPGVTCCAVYTVLAFARYGFDSVGSSRIAGLKWNDSVEQIWWLGWAAHTLPNIQHLFLAQGQDYPYGQNFGVNGSMLALGVLFAPITKIFGPVVAFNILLRLALAASAASMCFVLRRWTIWWPAAFVGGLLYGFSAYTSTFGSDLFLIFVPLPPLILMVLHEIFVRQRWRAGSAGIVLGLLCVLQFFIWVEVLAGTVVIGFLCVAIVLVFTRDKLAAAVALCDEEQLRIAQVSLRFFSAIHCGLLLPALEAFVDRHDRRHRWGVSTPTCCRHSWPRLISGLFRLCSQGVTTLTISVCLWSSCSPSSPSSFTVERRLSFPAPWRSWPLSLSPGILPHDQRTRIVRFSLPFALFAHLPALSGFEARRFALFTDLFVAAMFAIGMDELWKRARECRLIRPPIRWRNTLTVRARL